jgi:hypothetical protein
MGIIMTTLKKHRIVYEDESIDKAIDELIKKLELHFPNLSTLSYEAGDEITNFKDGLKFALYIELIRARLMKQ